MSNHKLAREGDEFACSCGLRWGVDEVGPHDIGVDLAKPGADRTTLNGHSLFNDSDFTEEELLRGNSLAVTVCEAALQVCRVCGAYESELTNPCGSKRST